MKRKFKGHVPFWVSPLIRRNAPLKQILWLNLFAGIMLVPMNFVSMSLVIMLPDSIGFSLFCLLITFPACIYLIVGTLILMGKGLDEISND